jgi:prepilin-type N-terminal cleavage/methylation domain-containing protein/prepilin-type processing-associated H-X9-DG protein
MKKAFTLIELLVVIAIIAILAAILFPVFAQAKMSAKKAVSISNLKQLTLGMIMYQGDSDDTVNLCSYTIQGPGSAPFPEIDWPQQIQPYVKNWPLFRDPGQNINEFGIWTSPASLYGWWANFERWPEYGYNVDYMNNAGGTCAGWAPQPGITSFGLPISATSSDAPADTVLLTTTKVVGFSGGAYESNASEAPGSLLADDTCTWSNGGWGIGSYGDCTAASCGGPDYPGNPTSTGTFATVYAKGGNATFLDGHAKFFQPGNLAQGTDWHVGVANNAIHILDKTKYLWSTTK